MYLKDDQNPRVLISILNWNNSSSTRSCLASVHRQTYGNYQILLVDNDSRLDPIDHLIKEFPAARYLSLADNYGYAGGHLQAIEYARKTLPEFDLVWLLNNDVVLEKDCLQKLVNAFQQKGSGIFGSLDNTQKYPRFWKVKENKPVFNEYSAIQDDCEIVTVGNIDGFSMLIPLTIIEKYGFMDTSYFLYGEETDYCLSLWSLSVPTYLVRSSLLDHSPKSSTRMNPRLEMLTDYYQRRNYLRLLKRHFGMVRTIQYIFAILREQLSLILKLHKSQRYVWLSLLHFLKGKFGKTLKPEHYI